MIKDIVSKAKINTKPFFKSRLARGIKDIINDPGVLFSAMHTIIFWNSIPIIAGLGIATLAGTVAVNGQRKIFPEYNDKIAKKVDRFLKKINAPEFLKPGLPLYINGTALTGVGTAALATGQFPMAFISLSFALANMSKGSQISGGWGIKELVDGSLKKLAKYTPLGKSGRFLKFMTKLKKHKSRFLNHSLYLPEFWASAGAFTVGIMGSGIFAALGASIAATGVAFAGINNNNPQTPAYKEKAIALKKHFEAVANDKDASKIQKIMLKGFGKVSSIPALSQIFDENSKIFLPSDAVMSRRQMKIASILYGITAGISGRYDLAIAHFLAANGNRKLEHFDLARQKQSLSQDMKPA